MSVAIKKIRKVAKPARFPHCGHKIFERETGAPVLRMDGDVLVIDQRFERQCVVCSITFTGWRSSRWQRA